MISVINLPNVKRTLLVVDDLSVNRLILRNIFETDYDVIEASNGRDALDIINRLGDSIAVVLLDILMPLMSGFDVLKIMNQTGIIKNVPVIVITSENDDLTNLQNYTLGVSDLIHKPFNADVVYRRVNNVAALYAHQHNLKQQLEAQKVMLEEQQKRLRMSTQMVIDSLSTAVEFRSFESNEHIIKIRDLTRIFMEEVKNHYSLTDNQIELISNASAVHDIGKIAIPDNILLKPGRLTSEEFEIMKTHPKKGGEVLLNLSGLNRSLDEEFFHYCYDICCYHHEKWDGNGYPYGLKGDEIPIWAQAASLADIYDALIAKRIYKPAYSHEKAIEMILDGQCGIINPLLLDIMVDLDKRGKLG